MSKATVPHFPNSQDLTVHFRLKGSAPSHWSKVRLAKDMREQTVLSWDLVPSVVIQWHATAVIEVHRFVDRWQTLVDLSFAFCMLWCLHFFVFCSSAPPVTLLRTVWLCVRYSRCTNPINLGPLRTWTGQGAGASNQGWLLSHLCVGHLQLLQQCLLLVVGARSFWEMVSTRTSPSTAPTGAHTATKRWRIWPTAGPLSLTVPTPPTRRSAKPRVSRPSRRSSKGTNL